MGAACYVCPTSMASSQSRPLANSLKLSTSSGSVSNSMTASRIFSRSPSRLSSSSSYQIRVGEGRLKLGLGLVAAQARVGKAGSWREGEWLAVVGGKDERPAYVARGERDEQRQAAESRRARGEALRTDEVD